MERESFEDSEVATLLNSNFVAIKVDREERPDIDQIYMTFCQALTGQGGWPLTIIMTPDKKPFFGGTYFPKNRKYGRPGLVEILTQVAEKWVHDQTPILTTANQITEALSTHYHSDHREEFSLSMLNDAVAAMEQSFDQRYGGFGTAPKFPTPHNLLFLLRYHFNTGHESARTMVIQTLNSMCDGGIWDHLGSGFSRYSTDEKWLVPHFEKMLYDNALLAIAYIEGYQVTHDERYRAVARDIFDYVLREMASIEGGFYSAEDADSEGKEGWFYVWDKDEIKATLDESFSELFCQYYGVTVSGNFEGRNILNLIGQDTEKFCVQHSLDVATFEIQLAEAKRALFNKRQQRIHPNKDDKILTAWNGLMIAALAKGARTFNDSSYLDMARRASDMILCTLRRDDGRLLARFRDGEASLLAYLDDYAFFVWGLIELYESSFDSTYLAMAVELTHDMARLFWDEDKGGFFLTGSDAEQLILRPKEVYDGALPSGNSVAAMGLLLLARITGENKFEEMAESTLRAFGGEVTHYPAGHSFYLMAVSLALFPTREVVIVGETTDPDYQAMIKAVRRHFLPNTVLVVKNPEEPANALLPLIKDYELLNGRPAAYVCERFSCKAPTDNLTELEKMLENEA